MTAADDDHEVDVMGMFAKLTEPGGLPPGHPGRADSYPDGNDNVNQQIHDLAARAEAGAERTRRIRSTAEHLAGSPAAAGTPRRSAGSRSELAMGTLPAASEAAAARSAPTDQQSSAAKPSIKPSSERGPRP